MSSKKQRKNQNQARKRIQNEDMAQKLLFDLKERLHETIPFLIDSEKGFYLLAIQQLQAMQRTIINNNEFYQKYFHNKTHKEIIDWINSESKKW